MPIRAIAILMIALVVGGLVFFITPRLIGAPPAANAPVNEPQGVNVLVAARDLPAGTQIKIEDLRWQAWPESALPSGALVRERGADMAKQAGQLVVRGISAGEPVQEARLAKPGESSILSAALAPGMRAATIKIDQVSGTAGFVTPGTLVDVVMTERFEKEDNAAQVQSRVKQVSSTVLEAVRVLAIDQNLGDMDGQPKVGATATLELGQKDAERLLLASRMGQLSLVVRSLADMTQPGSANPYTNDTDVSSFLKEIERRPQKPAAAPNRSNDAVTIWRPTTNNAAKP